MHGAPQGRGRGTHEICLIALPVAAPRLPQAPAGDARGASRKRASVAKPRESYEAFVVPSGVSRLAARADGRPHFSSLAPTAFAPTQATDVGVIEGVVVEALAVDSEWRLLMLQGPSQSLRVNAQPAPRAQVLQVGDQVQMHPDFVLHVSAFRQPWIDRAGQERAGTECLLCRTPFEEDARVYACFNCGGSLHHEDDATKSALHEQPLACATMCKTCPSCAKEVVLEPGYEFVPSSR